MNKITTAALGAALAVACASASAADANGAFFVNAGIGQSQYHVGHTDGLGYKLDEKDTAGALRFGYAWKMADGFDLGLEGGYANLGKVVANYHAQTLDGSLVVNEHADAEVSGWMLGANGKYTFSNKWYVSARAGWFRSTTDATYRYEEIYADGSGYGEYASGDANGDGWYGGVGVGYSFTRNFSLGLNYDNYHGKAKTNLADLDANIGVYTVTAEYRF